MSIITFDDVFTVGGLHEKLPNPAHRWWQFWKPRFVIGRLQKFRVVEII